MRLIIPQTPGCSFYLLSRAALCGAPDAFHIMEQLCDILTIPGVDLQLRTLFGAHDLPETNESLTEVIQIIFHTVWCDEDNLLALINRIKKEFQLIIVSDCHHGSGSVKCELTTGMRDWYILCTEGKGDCS